MNTGVQRTGLYEEHLALGGRMVSFAGWELPIQYNTGPTIEHQAVRTAAGLFDIDHMGQIRVSGIDAIRFLNYLQTADLGRVEPMQAQYALLCYADGGTVDDIFLYRLEDYWLTVVNAANRSKDLAWLHAHAASFDVVIEDISADTYMLAIQGPRAQEILQSITDRDLATLSFHNCSRARVAEVPMLIGATGYTGEYGYELYFPEKLAVKVWRTLLEAGKPTGLLPCGLAARDSLRFEPALPLYGHELTASIDPLTAGLGYFVHFEKAEFIGREALLKTKLEGPSHRLVGFEMQDTAVPREGYTVVADDKEVGWVTSGMKAPTLNRFLGMAIVPSAYSTLGTEIAIVVRGMQKKAIVVKRPFYTPAYRK